MRARIAWLQFEGGPIRSLSLWKFARITRIVPVTQRIFELFFDLRGIWSGWPCHGRPRPGRIAGAFGFRILRSKNSSASAQVAAGFLSASHTRINQDGKRKQNRERTDYTQLFPGPVKHLDPPTSSRTMT